MPQRNRGHTLRLVGPAHFGRVLEFGVLGPGVERALVHKPRREILGYSPSACAELGRW